MLAGVSAWFVVAALATAVGVGLRLRRPQTLSAIGALVVTLLAVEVSLRATYAPAWRPLRKLPSSRYHHVNHPDASLYDGRVEGQDIVVSTNQDGFRSSYDRREFLRFRERIVVMGDSFVFGAGVRQSAAFPQVLEGLLRQRLGRADIAVLNAGIISYSPLLAQRSFDGIVAQYRPTTVLFALDVTDIGDDFNYEQELVADGAEGHFDWTGLEVQPYYGALGQVVRLERFVDALARPVAAGRRLVGLAPAPRRKYNWYRFRAEVGGRTERNRFFIYRHPLEDTRPYFDRSYGYIAALARSVRQSGAVFTLIVLPRYHHWNPAECPDNWEADQYTVNEPYQFEYFRYFEERREDAPFEIYSLLPAFRATRESPLTFRDDPHWNEAGHAFVARTLADHRSSGRPPGDG